MSAHRWFFIASGNPGDPRCGPIGERELAREVRAGRLTLESLVFSPTRSAGKWYRVRQVPALASIRRRAVSEPGPQQSVGDEARGRPGVTADRRPQDDGQPAVWKTRPIFLSSTFRDMHAERDYLRRHVLPVLEERLRARRHHLETVDLRWGVETGSAAEQQAKELLVLKVCLAEVERCRPFLVAFLGDRYGWVPPAERVEAAAREAGFAEPVAGKSVTALEIEFGVLADTAQQQGSFFYFRQPLPYERMTPERAAVYRETDPEAARRLAELKARIERQMPDRVRHYRAGWDAERGQVTGLEALGQMVLEDLWRELDEQTRQFAAEPAPTWQAQERWALEQFVEERGRSFIGREQISDQLVRLAVVRPAAAGPWGACVHGPPGSGKSALFAHLFRRLHTQSNVLLLAHAAGITPVSARVDSMLRRWTGELADALGVPDPLTDTSSRDEMEQSFQTFLRRAASGRRVVLLMDALDQFERTPRARYLTWLPKPFPENACLIATAIRGSESGALERREGVQLLRLPPLTAAEARQMATAVCRRYHRALNDRVLGALLAKKVPRAPCAESREPRSGELGPSGAPLAVGNPLWLELALDELNLLDADDFARAERQYTGTGQQRLLAMMLDVARRLPPTVEQLYGHMLARSEKVFGTAWARAFASLITISRQGWRESDLSRLMPQAARLLAPDEPPEAWDALRLAALRRGYRAHLVQRGHRSQWDFFHAQMREAVRRRNLTDAGLARQLHALVADHLDRRAADDPLRQEELTYHLIRSGDRVRAARHCAADLTRTESHAASRDLAALVAAGEAEDPNPGLVWVASLLQERQLSTEERWRLSIFLLRWTYHALAGVASLKTRMDLLCAVRRVLEQTDAPAGASDELRCALPSCYLLIGNVQSEQGNYAEAIAACRAGLRVLDAQAAAAPVGRSLIETRAALYHGISRALYEQGDLDAASEAARQSRELTEQLAERDRLESQERAQTLEQQTYERLTGALRERDAVMRASQSARTTDGVAISLYADDGQPTRIHVPGGVDLLLSGSGAEASPFRVTFDVSSASLNEVMDRAAASAKIKLDQAIDQLNAGDILREKGSLQAARAAYQQALSKVQGAVRALPKRHAAHDELEGAAASCHAKLARVLLLEGKESEAEAELQSARGLMEKVALRRPDDPEVLLRRVNILHLSVGTLIRQHRCADALPLCREAHRLAVQSAERGPDNVKSQQILSAVKEALAVLLLRQDDRRGALACCRDSRAIIIQLASAHPENMALQLDLERSHFNAARIFQEAGQSEDALCAYREAVAIGRTLLARDPRSVQHGEAVLASQLRIVEICLGKEDSRGALAAAQDAWHGIRQVLAEQGGDRYHALLWASLEPLEQRLASQGKPRETLEFFQLAGAIARDAIARAGAAEHWLATLWLATSRAGDLLLEAGDPEGALRYYADSIDAAGALREKDRANPWPRKLLAGTYRKRGRALQQQGNLSAAHDSYRRCITMQENLLREHPGDALALAELSDAQESVGQILYLSGDTAAAVEAYRAAVASTEQWRAKQENPALPLRLLESRLAALGHLLWRAHESQAALECFRSSCAAARRLLETEGTGEPRLVWTLIRREIELGEMMLQLGDPQNAFEQFQDVLRLANQPVFGKPQQPEQAYLISVVFNHMGDILLGTNGNPEASLAAFREAHAIRQQLARNDPAKPRWQRALSISHEKIGDVLRAQGDLPAALSVYHPAVAIAEQLAAQDLKNAGWQRDLAVLRYKLADVYQQLKDAPSAARYRQLCHATLSRMVAQNMDLDPAVAQLFKQLKQEFST